MSGFWNNWTGGAMVAHARSARTLVWGGALVVLALVLANLPLFNVLGFEFAFALAVAISLASIDLGAAYVRRLRTSGMPLDRAHGAGRLVAVIAARATLVNLTGLVVPVLVLVVNGFRVRNCDFGFGFRAVLYMPVVSCVLATVIGVLCGLIAGDRTKLSNLLPYAIVLVSTLVSLAHFYGAPQVFSYNLFVGYFPGNLYDESISFHRPFYWARLYQALTIIACAGVVALLLDTRRLAVKLRGERSPMGVRWRVVATTVVAGIGALQLHLSDGDLGFSIEAQDIKRRLGGRHETPNFIIYYPRGTEVERDIELIADDHEFRYAQLQRRLGTQGGETKIVSYFFRDAEQKFHYMGARNVLMAKPWRREIYMQFSAYPYRALRHEIAHVLAGTFGDPLFNVSARGVLGLPLQFNVGLIEGIAVAADWPGGEGNALTPHQSVKAMIGMGMAPPVDHLFSTGFLKFSAARSYTLAGSFVRFLLDEHGPRPLRALYRSGGDFVSAYGESQRALVKRWRAMIDGIRLPDGAAEIVRDRFRRRSIIHRPCPHAIGRARRRANAKAESGRLDEAIAIMRDVCKDAPEEPFYQLQLAGLLRAAGSHDEAAVIYKVIAADHEGVSSPLRANAMLQLATHAVRNKDLATARRLLATAGSLPLDDNLARNVKARRLALDHTGPAGPVLREYFFRDTDKGGFDAVVLVGLAGQAVALEPSLGLGHYLLGRNLRDRRAPEAAVRSLATALDLGLPGPLFEREATRQLTIAAYLAGDYATATRAATRLTRASEPEMVRLNGADWLARIHWKQTGALPAAASGR